MNLISAGGLFAVCMAILLYIISKMPPGQPALATSSGSAPGSSMNFSSGNQSGSGNSSTSPELKINAPSQVARWQPIAKKWADAWHLPWQIVLADIWQESGGDPNAISSANAKGLMQLKDIAVEDVRQTGFSIDSDWAYNPNENVKAGTAFMALQVSRTGNLSDGLKAYYDGYKPDGNYSTRAKTYETEVMNKAYQLGYLGLT